MNKSQISIFSQVVAEDLDEGANAEVTYSIDASSIDISEASVWSIDSSGGWSPVSQLDYDSGPQLYQFLVNAVGVADPTKTDATNLNITVLNCNDEAPFFAVGDTLYFSIAEEDYNVATTVTPVTPANGLADVSDLDSTNFTYEVIAGENANYFTVDANTGEILTAVSVIDAELISQFNLTVRVNDTDSLSLSTEVFCIIDVTDKNEFAPVCGANQYIATVSEDASVNSSVITVTATDADQGQTVDFEIKKQVYRNGTDPAELNATSFTIDSNSGLITVGSTLDYETGTRILLDVCATDSGSPTQMSSTCSVTLIIIDVNDNTPVFINVRSTDFYSKAYPCDGSGSTVYPIITVEAIDNDQSGSDFSRITFEFVDLENDIFELDQTTGNLS